MTFIDAQGRKVSAAQAMPNGILLPGYQKSNNGIVADGEYISFDVTMMDAKSKTDPDDTSIDAMLRASIATAAENRNTTPAEYLAGVAYRDLEELAVKVARSVIATLASRGIAAKMGDAKAEGVKALARMGKVQPINETLRPVIDGLAKYKGLTASHYIARLTIGDLESMASHVTGYTDAQRPALQKMLTDASTEMRRNRFTVGN